MQQYFYRMLEDGTCCVTEYHGDEADVIIPDTYCGKPVTVLFDRLFRGHTEITSIKIPDTVTDIGSFVFDGCSSLKKHAWAFHGCTSLKDFQCSENTEINEDAFKEGKLIGYGGKRSG